MPKQYFENIDAADCIIQKHTAVAGVEQICEIIYEQKRKQKSRGKMVPRSITICRFFKRSIILQNRMLHSESLHPKLSKIGVPIGGIAGLFGSMLGVGGGVIMVDMCKNTQVFTL
jgi:hypothetical protein